MGIVSGGLGGGPAAGSYLPVAGPAGATLDTTTYDNEVTASGKFHTLVFPTDNGALAMAVSGDAHPRVLLTASGGDGIYLGPGTAAITSCPNLYAPSTAALEISSALTVDGTLVASPAVAPTNAPRLSQLSPTFTITSGALPQLSMSSGVGLQVALAQDVETVTPVTFNPTAGAAATCKVELSPDNVTYSILGIETEPAGLAFDGTIRLVRVRVPAGWYLKLTATNASIGATATYY